MGFHPANFGFLGLSVLELDRGTRQTGRGIINQQFLARRNMEHQHPINYYKVELSMYCEVRDACHVN